VRTNIGAPVAVRAGCQFIDEPPADGLPRCPAAEEVLDGDSLFPMLAPEHLFLNIDEKLPEVVTVGIAYGWVEPSINKRDMDFAASGVAAFQRYLKSELVPEIERRYRVDPDRRVLFGQSLGGSFVLYSAFMDP